MKFYDLARTAFVAGALLAVLGGCSSAAGSQFAPPAAMELTATGGPSGVARKAGSHQYTWWQYYYNLRATRLRRTRATVSNGTASFSFTPGVYTALLVTQARPLTGNLTGKTLNDTITVSGTTGSFVTENGGGCGNPPAVRFYFSSSGSAYTDYWWSNPDSYVLANGSTTLSVSLGDPSQWSDWLGQFGNYNEQEFEAAVASVNQVGVSYGGDCFFENGATVNYGTALFSSQFSEM